MEDGARNVLPAARLSALESWRERVRRGMLTVAAAASPTAMRNWTRMGVTFAFLSLMLTTAVDFVIRHVEESSRTAAEALTDLRVAYARLALLHERFDAAKEEERRFIAHEASRSRCRSGPEGCSGRGPRRGRRTA